MIEYLNENEGRAYPFINSSAEGIPDELVTSLVISGPRAVIATARLSSLVKRGELISLSISSDYGGLVVCTRFAPEASIPYPLTTVTPGVGGFVIFGDGLSDIEDFNKVNISVAIDPGALRPSPERGVSSINKYGVTDASSLRGLVNLRVNDAMTLEADGNIIRIGINDSSARDFQPKCNRRAVFEECGDPPIRKIAGVPPDENGLITVEFQNNA